MFIHRITKKNKKKTYTTILLQKSFRNKKTNSPRHKTIANLSDWSEELIENFEKLLKGGKISDVNNLSEILHTEQGKIYGGIKTVLDLCVRLGINKAINNKRMCFLTNIMIAGFINGEKFSKNFLANEWSKLQAIDEVFGKQGYWNEDDLYETL